TSSTTAANRSAFAAVMSDDGRYVAWSSDATDVVSGQSGGGDNPPPTNVFLFDRTSGANRLVGPRGFPVSPHAFSPGGRFLFYQDFSTPYLYDVTSGVSTRIVPPNPYGLQATSGSLSADGRYVTFTATVSGFSHVQVFDRVSHTLEDLGNGFESVLSAD